MKRIIITRSNPIEPDSRVEKEANSLIKAGYDVCLVAWERDENFYKKDDLKQLADCKVRRIRFGAKASYGAGMKNIIPFMRFQISLFIWLIKNRRMYDICHFCDFDTAFIGSIACKFTKKKYVFDIFDYLSTEPRTRKQKIIEKLENKTINGAIATIICTEQRKKQISKSNPRNLTVIHNSPAKNFFSLKETKIKGIRTKIAYVGILQEYRLIKEMIEVISSMPDVELHIGGFGKLEDDLLAASSVYENIIYYGKLSYKDTLQLESQCDILTAMYDPKIGNHRYAAPNKFYEALFLGKPLIMVKGTGMSNIVSEENIGVLIDYSKDGFKDGIETLIGLKSQWKIMGKKMQRVYLQKYSWDEMERRLRKLYFEICEL